MKPTHAALAVAAAALLGAPAFAQSSSCTVSSDNLRTTCVETSILGAGPVLSSNGAVISSGTGVVVTPGAPAAIAVAPAPVIVAVPGTRVLPGAARVEASQTTVMGAPAAPGVTSTTLVTNYWVNVPAGVENRADFQRWLHLKP